MGLSILFVDDDEGILQAIGRILKMERSDIEYTLSAGSAEALNILENRVFDAVVADYCMPGMDGLAFLETVRRKYPAMKRVLLTGQSEAQVYEKAASIVDRYMAKPCDTLAIIDEIEMLIKEG